MSVHEDTLQRLQEALSYAQDRLKLKTTDVEASDEEIEFYSVFGMLSESNNKEAYEI
ncbi:MAG: hypothetical protein FWH55_12955 [Oscillospiraceae bacterium]|nr:hypothetical protein [Oscillospiraceae bacterium]